MKINFQKYKWYFNKSIIIGISISICFIIYSNHQIEKESNGKTFNQVDSIQYNKTALLLGTSKMLSNGRLNLYFKYRIDAATELYFAGKIEKIIISGDNSTKDYNEPQDMKDNLINKGIPEDRIYLDYAGFRTFDSVIRMKEIFGQTKFTIISQKFHNQRALYIASFYGINARAFNANDVGFRGGIKTKIRESLARTKAILDLWFGQKPKFLGEKIEIK